jgi:hypothetical protein
MPGARLRTQFHYAFPYPRKNFPTFGNPMFHSEKMGQEQEEKDREDAGQPLDLRTERLPGEHANKEADDFEIAYLIQLLREDALWKKRRLKSQ